MDGLVPAAPAGAMQSATIGALLGSLSAEEKLGVLAGLFQFIQPSQATSPSANRALKIAEALMADKPSSELAGLVGVAGSSRLQQMTPPVEVKKETRDFGVQVEPPPAILPPPRVFEDRAASTAAPSRRTDADSQTDAYVHRTSAPRDVCL
ncbi:hypothetical protein EXIGLDRAFT_133033 [Exidia glandulosa HHB12029]|uniref:Uncharacterized protein n=1 Tax=Exidia glandulosa HHB12029 TaxID=1314781 RepID=A0A166BFQ3_EXIGL|nr:hypothetical protein EXIGLDRAFT_133033 [Exidia glandulosa HHB12029]